MIGGYDTVLDGTASSEEVALMLRLLGEAWPNRVVESGDGTIVLDGREDAAQVWAIPCELFIYGSREAYQSWTDHGLTGDNAARMISVSVEPDAMSFVVNAPESETARHVKLVMQAIREDRLARHTLPAARAAARWSGSPNRQWFRPEPAPASNSAA
jgi:hypothetical protein